MHAVTAGADDVGAFRLHVERHRMRDHRLGGAGHLLLRQAELLLRGEHGAHRGRVGVAAHQVIDEPLRLFRGQVLPAHEFAQIRLPCDLFHSAPYGLRHNADVVTHSLGNPCNKHVSTPISWACAPTTGTEHGIQVSPL